MTEREEVFGEEAGAAFGFVNSDAFVSWIASFDVGGLVEGSGE